jgi:hypothetical protein
LFEAEEGWEVGGGGLANGDLHSAKVRRRI